MNVKLTELTKDSVSIIEEYVRSKPFVPLFFYSPFTLITWLTHQGKKLYLAELYDAGQVIEQSIIVHKEQKNDVRILFHPPSEILLKELSQHFSPSYIACNEISEIPAELIRGGEDEKSGAPADTQSQMLKGTYFDKKELLLDIDSLLELRDQDIRRYLKAATDRNPSLEPKEYTPDDFGDVKTFLSAWNNTRSPEYNKYARTENDMYFLECFGTHPDVHGVIIKDKEVIVGISFFTKAIDGNAIAVINKCLRGYKQLGVLVFIERARQMRKYGYKKAYIGPINNDFKKKFIPCSEIVHSYYFELGRKELFNPNQKYLSMIF